MERKNIFEEKSIISRGSSTHSRDLSPISAPFSQVSASLFDQPHARQPTQEPLSASVNILLPAYTVATRRHPSPVYSPVAGPFYSSSAPPLPIVSVHYQHPGNDHQISQTRGKFPNEFCIRDFNSHQVSYHRFYHD